MSQRLTPPASSPSSAALGSVVGHLSVDQIRVNDLVDAVAALEVRGVPVAVVGEQYARLELIGEPNCPLVWGGRVPGRADHEDRRRTLSSDRRRPLAERDRPVLARQVAPGQVRTEVRRRGYELRLVLLDLRGTPIIGTIQ